MKALPLEKLPEGDWLYEIKHDGYRALVFDALKLLPAEYFILDGEIAALDEKGRSSFQLLQDFKSSGDVPLVYYVFDLLFLDRKDLRKEPLSTRRKLLANLLKKPPENIRLSDELRGSKDDLLRVAQEFGLEGSGRQTPKFSLRKRSSQRRLDQIQDHQVSGVRYRRLHVA